MSKKHNAPRGLLTAFNKICKDHPDRSDIENWNIATGWYNQVRHIVATQKYRFPNTVGTKPKHQRPFVGEKPNGALKPIRKMYTEMVSLTDEMAEVHQQLAQAISRADAAEAKVKELDIRDQHLIHKVADLTKELQIMKAQLRRYEMENA